MTLRLLISLQVCNTTEMIIKAMPMQNEKFNYLYSLNMNMERMMLYTGSRL